MARRMWEFVPTSRLTFGKSLSDDAPNSPMSQDTRPLRLARSPLCHLCPSLARTTDRRQAKLHRAPLLYQSGTRTSRRNIKEISHSGPASQTGWPTESQVRPRMLRALRKAIRLAVAAWVPTNTLPRRDTACPPERGPGQSGREGCERGERSQAVMSPELIGILGVGGGLAILMLGLFAWLRSNVGEIRHDVASLRGRDVGDLRERMARVETLLGGHDSGPAGAPGR